MKKKEKKKEKESRPGFPNANPLLPTLMGFKLQLKLPSLILMLYPGEPVCLDSMSVNKSTNSYTEILFQGL